MGSARALILLAAGLASGSSCNRDPLANGVVDAGAAIPDSQFSSVDLRREGADLGVHNCAGGPIQFSQAAIQTVAPSPQAISLTNLKGDGVIDAIVLGMGGELDVAVSNGHGGFGTPVAFQTTASGASLAIADFDGDGLLDIATVPGPSILFGGAGSSAFQRSVHLSTPGYVATYLAAASLPHTGGMAGLILGAEGTPAVEVMLNNGGTLGSVIQTPVAKVTESIAVTDLNHDGFPDIVVAEIDRVQVLLGSQTGFHSPQTVGTGEYLGFLCLGDLDGDGQVDVAVPDVFALAVLLYWGNGDGTFAAGTPINLPSGPNHAICVDLNCDGYSDLVTSNGQASASVLVSHGSNRSFSVAQTLRLAAGAMPWALAAADLNGDVLPDVVVSDITNSTITTFLQGL